MGAAVLGAHLEGPWISPQRAGAHDPRFLRSPNLGDLRHLLDSMPGVIRVVTVAPELPGAMALIQALVASRVVAAVGHTDADAAMVEAAFEAGATHVTHLFNAMPPMHHRQPGPVGAALADERVTVEVIADGVHLDPRILRVVLRAAAGRVVAVTDAVSAGDRVVQDAAGHMVLAESPQTLAGSTLTLDRAVAALVEAGASLSEAVRAASATPARVIGADRHGVLRPGARADLAVLGADLRCTATMVGGHVVYDPDGVLS
jgi:N-acetylglucosamine-6-phosphate deacetylase